MIMNQSDWLPVSFSEVKTAEIPICFRDYQSDGSKVINHVVTQISSAVEAALAEGARGISATWENKLDRLENPDGLLGKIRLVYQR